MKRRRFKKVRKTKKGTPLKYLSGSKNRKKSEREIKRTSRLYKAGKLTPAMYDAISKRRAASGKKKKKK
tara:strand:+ start:91 stop:297 length:207 start_codon:yes stop_codon:yes gene_type:complete